MKISLLCLFAFLASFAGAQSAHAPELVGSKWLNTDGKPVTLASRQGKVTLVHFWTFACNNCQANLPAYNRLYRKFKERGVEMIGIHTPELAIEKDDANVAKAVKKWQMEYPVLIDGDGANWNNWRQEVWPTIYVLDHKGNVVYRWVGELAWRGANGEQQVISAVERLLKK